MAEKWKIYDKNGVERQVQWSQDESESASKYVLPQLEYHGSWMDQCFVTLNVKCAIPIDFAIGDYLIYRGEKFVINYDPTVIKKARRETHGEGFSYDNIKFNSLSYELTDISFLDYVLADNGIHYSSLPKFPFYAASIEDFCDRLQANTNRYCESNGFDLADYWLFLTPDRARTIQRSSMLRKNNGVWEGMPALEVATRWDNAFGQWAYTYNGVSYNGGGLAVSDVKTDINVTIDNQTIWGAMALVKSEFGLNFITRGRSVIIGAGGIPTSHIFKYGKGQGLYEIERTADQDQQIITKLFAYGSSKNLPTRYYANLNMSVYGIVTGVSGSTIDLNIIWRTELFNGAYDSANSGYRATIKIDNTNYSVYCYQKYNSNVVSVAGLNSNTAAEFSAGDKMYFVSGVDIDKWPNYQRDYSTDNLPNNMAINVLLLPGFPNQSLYDWVKANGGTDCNDSTGLATWEGYTAYFSKNQYQPYILSPNHTLLGIREATKYFDGSEDTDEIYPTIEGTGYDVIYHADKISDNGIYPEGEEVKGFNITLPDFGNDFDLKELISQSTDSAKIAMKDGFCGGREFEIVNVEHNNNGTWTCDCKRTHDEALDLWFPYSYNISIGRAQETNEPYQICDGDHYVLLGIPMTSTYVEANAEKLLLAALEFLSKNDYTRYTYSPKIDEIFMAYQHDASQDVQNGMVSIHDTIKEGGLLLFEDDDLDIDGSVFIDTLNIKEYGNAQIPTYEVTLRDDKQVGQIQRIQNKINSLTSLNGAGATDIPAVRQLIETYGRAMFLSRLYNDTAFGKITFKQGLQSDKDAEFGEFVQDASGAGIYQDSDGAWHIEGDYLHARRKLIAKEVQVEEVKHVGGQQMLTAASMLCDYVIDCGAYYRCFFLKKDTDTQRTIYNKFVIGDQAQCQTFNLTKQADGTTQNQYYWRLVVGTDEQSDVSDFNDDFFNYTRAQASLPPSQRGDFSSGGTLPNGVDVAEYHWIDLSKSDCAAYSDVPKAGDEIVQLGNRNETSRQNAIVLAGAGQASPYIYQYVGINSYVMPAPDTKIKPGDNLFSGLVQMHADSTFAGQRVGDIFAAYQTDIENLKDNITTLDDDINNVEDYIENGLSTGNENLLRNTGFTGDYTSMEVLASQSVNNGTPIYSDPFQYWENDGANVSANVVSASGFAADLSDGYIQQQVTKDLMLGQTYCLSFRGRGVGSVATLSLGGVSESIVLDGTIRRYTRKIVVVDASKKTFRLSARNAHVMEIMVTEGTIPNTDWIPSPLDNDKTLAYYQNLVYLANAIANASTSILGGLILTQMIRVGNYRDGEMTEETGGMSGLYTSGNSPFLWGGGNMEQAFYTINKYLEDPSYQATDEEVAQMAKFVVTHGGRAILNDIILRGYVYAKGGYFKGEINAESGVFKNVHSPDYMFALDENGRMSCKDAHISGNIYTPMTVIDETNWDEYVVSFAGWSSVLLNRTGLNLQFNYVREAPSDAPSILVGKTIVALPLEEQYVGARVNILNMSGLNISVYVNRMQAYYTLESFKFGMFICYMRNETIQWLLIN